MDEPILTSEQKQEWIDLFNYFISCIDSCCFRSFKIYLFNCIKQNFCDVVRFKCCELMEIQESLPDYDCSKCWWCWFILYHEEMTTPTDDNINEVFIGIPLTETTKRDDFSCYAADFECYKQQDKGVLLTLFNNAINHLTT